MAMPHATEQIQWGDNLVFKVAGKMFAVGSLEPSALLVSFKCDEEEFANLIETPGFVPAPYMARAKWAAIESDARVSRAELERLLRRSYELVVAKLPRKLQAELALKPAAQRPSRSR